MDGKRLLLELIPDAARDGHDERDTALNHTLFYTAAPALNLADLETHLHTFVAQVSMLLDAAPNEEVLPDEIAQVQQVGTQLFDWLRQRSPGLAAQLVKLGKDDRLTIDCREPALAAYPWELLYDAKNGRYLGLDCTIIRRQVQEIEKPPDLLPLPLPLQILGIDYSTSGLDVAADTFWATMADFIEPLRERGLCTLRRLSEDELFDFLELGALPEDIQGVDVLQILAHGDAPTDGGLASMNLGDVDYTGAQLADILLDRLPDLRLVLLASCETGKQATEGVVRTVTAAFLQQQIAAVVGMQYTISVDAAVFFFSGLYRSLAEGVALDLAVLNGRQESTRIHKSVEWGTPVVYTALDDLRLFAPLSPQERTYRHELGRRLLANTPRVADYLPMEVAPVTTGLDKEGVRAAGRSSRGLLVSHRIAATTINRQSQAIDAYDLCLDNAGQLRRPVTILLGDASSGKSSVLDRLIQHLVPAEVDKARRWAFSPHAVIPLRLSLGVLGTNPDSYRLQMMLWQAVIELWKTAVSREQAPTIDDITGWANSKAWRFLVILEDLKEILPQERTAVSRLLRRLIQANPQHYFIIAATPDAFADYTAHLDRYPQWQTSPLRKSIVQKELEKSGRHVNDPGFLTLLQQPWALHTFKRMVNEGHITIDQATLLHARIDHLLAKINYVQRNRILLRTRNTLIVAALEMGRGWHAGITVDKFFALMERVRSRRSYNLERLYNALINARILTVRTEAGVERIRFQQRYLFAMFSALGLNRELRQTPELLANYEIIDTDFALQLVILSQLHDENMVRILQELNERLSEVDNEWELSLFILDIAVRCAQHKSDVLTIEQRRDLIGKLAHCLVRKNHEGRLRKWLSAQPLTGQPPTPISGIDLDAHRLRQVNMRVRVLELLGDADDPAVFEMLRWFVMEPKRPDKPDILPHRYMRQTALQFLLRKWQAALESPQALYLAFLKPYPTLQRFLQIWHKARDRETADNEAFEQLVEMSQNKKLLWLRSAALMALGDVASRRTEHLALIISSFKAQLLKESCKDFLWIIGETLNLIALLPDDSPLIAEVEEAVIALALKKTRSRKEKIKELHGWRREVAISVLGNLRLQHAFAPLLKLLTSQFLDIRLRARAAWAVGQCGVAYPNHASLPEVRAALREIAAPYPKDKGWRAWPQAEAIAALGLLGDNDGEDNVVALLLELVITDPKRSARRKALQALQQIMAADELVEKLLAELSQQLLAAALDKARFCLQALAAVGDEKTVVRLLKIKRVWPQESEELGEDIWVSILRTLKQQYVAPAAPVFPGRNLRLRENLMQGEDVYAVEKRLWDLGYAAMLRAIMRHYTEAVETAVTAFQQRNQGRGLEVTGVVDAQTWRRMFSPRALQGPGGLLPAGTAWPEFNGPYFRQDEWQSDPCIRLIQGMLWDLGYAEQIEEIDGEFGPNTHRAVVAWQRTANLDGNGRIDEAVWQALKAEWEHEERYRVRPGIR